jgi:hypothetical protein
VVVVLTTRPTQKTNKQARLRRLDQGDPAAVLAVTEEVLTVLDLPAPTLPPHAVEVAALPGLDGGSSAAAAATAARG